MYGLSKGENLDFLKGVKLLQLCIGSNEVILNFSRDISITIESRLDFLSHAQSSVTTEAGPASAATLAKLLSDTITGVRGSSDGAIHLSFAKGTGLVIHDSSGEYESYQIKHGDEIIVV